jgi:hypothetical protein
VVEISAGGYLLDALFEAGPDKPGAMGGDLPLEWPDVWAYMQATQAIVEPWEARALREMSIAYADEKCAATDLLRKAPTDRFKD